MRVNLSWMATLSVALLRPLFGTRCPRGVAVHIIIKYTADVAATGDRLRNPSQLHQSPVAAAMPPGASAAENLITGG